jgi:predicted PurR-regulated permease PerM
MIDLGALMILFLAGIVFLLSGPTGALALIGGFTASQLLQ